MQIASRTSRYLLTAHFSSPIPLERRSTETVVPIASFGVVPSNRKQKNSELAQARRTNLGDECHVVGLWRHHPTDAGARRQWLIVVGPDIGLAPSAGCTSAPTFYVFDCLGGVEAFYRHPHATLRALTIAFGNKADITIFEVTPAGNALPVRKNPVGNQDCKPR